MAQESRIPMRLRAALAGVGLLALSLLSCGREVTGPGDGVRFATGLSFISTFPGPLASVAEGAGSVVPFTRVRVVFRREDGSVALDQVVDFPSDADSVVLDLQVPLSGSAPASGEPLSLTLAYVNAAGDTVFRGGPVPVVAKAHAPGSPPPPPAPVPLTYVGPGASATTVTVATDTLTLVAGDPFTITATARDGQGAVVTGVPLVFSSLDVARATLASPSSGAGTTTASRGIARILVQLPTGAAEDTAMLVVLPKPAALSVVSGGGQSAFTGAGLANPVVGRLVATDGQPIPGVAVAFAVTAGGGNVTPTGGVTDGNGQFAFSWTLGPAIGTQTVSVTSAGVTALPVNATATFNGATQLRITQQVGTSYLAGDSIPALLVEAQLPGGGVDVAFADSVFLAFAQSPVGATLTGDTRVRAVAGVARFDNFRLTRAGTYRLRVNAAGLASDSSATITVAPRAASALSLVSGGNQVAAPGTALPAPVVVRAADGYGNGVAGITVSFAAPGGLSVPSAVTDAAGLASVNWTLALSTGAQSLVATAPGLTGSPLTITATGSAGIATTTVSPALDTLTAIGATRTIIATSRDGAAGLVPGSYAWTSRNVAVATVDDSGHVVAVTNGATWVVAVEAGGTRDSARVVVEQRLATIRVTPDPRDIYLGASYAFSAQAVDGRGIALASQPTVTWSTGSSAIASVSAAGIATGVGLGSTQVRATSGAVTGVAALTVRTPITRIAVVRDSATFVTTDTFTLGALASTRSYRAIAHDTLDAVMPGISFAWASSNPSVASLDSVGSATSRALAAANGVTAVRASAQGVIGSAVLTVQQVMTAIDLSPASVSVAPTGSVVLTPRRRDANGYFISGGSFTFNSADGAVATVSAAGVVTGVSIGATTVTATSGAITSPAVTVTVTNAVPAIISFGRDTLAIGRSATNAAIPVYLSRPNAGAVTVNLAVADTFAFFNPASISIAAGQTAGTANLNGRNAGTTQLFATDGSGTGYAGDTAVLAVQAGVRFTSGSYNLMVNDEIGTQVLLTDPAPAGGAYITYTYGTPGRVSISPDPAFIPAGQLSANVVVRGLSAGGSTITPAATGVTGTSSSVSTQAANLQIYRPSARIGSGQYDDGGYVSSPLNLNTSLPVALASTDTSVLSVTPAVGTIPGGSYYFYYRTDARAPGSATIGATATGWAGITTPIIVTSPRLVLSGGGALNTTSPQVTATVYAEDSTYSAHYRSSALAVSVSSSDTAVLRVIAPSITIGAGAYYASAVRVIPGGAPGTAWIRVSASGHFADSVQYTVVGPRLRISLEATRIGAGQYLSGGYVYTPDNVTQPLVVHLHSTDSTLASLPDSVIIPTGTYYAYYTLRGRAPGVANIRATAAGYTPDSADFSVTTPKIVLSGGGTYNAFAPPVVLTVYPADSLNGAHNTYDTLFVSHTSSDAAVVTVSAADTVLPGTYYSQRARVTIMGQGSAWVRTSAPGYRPDSVFYTVVTPKIQFSFTTYRIGRRQYRQPTDFYVSTPNNVGAPLNVTITQSNAAADSLTATALTIPGGTYYAYFGFAGLATGTDTLIVTAPGYLPDTAIVTITSPMLTGAGLPGSATTTSPPATTTIYVADSVGNAHYSLDTLLLSARSSNDAVLQPDSVGFRLPRGAYYVQPRVRFVGPGSATITYSDSLGTGYGSLSSNAPTVTGPSLGFVNSRPVMGMRQYGIGTGAYVTIPNGVAAPLVVHLLSTDSTVASVPDSVIIPPGTTYAYVDVRARDVVGTVQLQATALGYASANTTQQVTTPRFLVSGPGSMRTTQGPQTITVQAADANGNAHYVWEPVTVTLTSSNVGAATVDSASVVIPVGNYYTQAARVVAVAAGSTTITASDARVASYRYADATTNVAITTPALAVSWGGSMSLGIGQWVEPYASAPDNQPSPLTLALTHASGATSSAASLQIPGGTYYVYHRITGVSSGVDTVTYVAAGHQSVRGAIDVAAGRSDQIGGWPATLGTDSVAVTLYARSPDGTVRNVSATTTFAIGIAGAALEVHQGGVAVTSVTIPVDASSITFYLRRLANGTSTVTFTNANYQTHVAPTVLVTGAP